MNKEIYLIRGTADENYTDFRTRIFKVSQRVIKESYPDALSLTITEAPPPALSVIPFKRGKIAAISVFKNDSRMVEPLVEQTGFTDGYRVEEALPVSYTRDWNDGQVTPGICLLTLFRQKKGISYTTFLDRWHNSHTPMSLRFHPLWHYNRNVARQVIAARDEPWDGIVEEHFRTRADLLNPFRFFGNPLVILSRMISVYRDTNSFLDYSTIEPWLVREYHIKDVK
ncbi:MAG: hypothetical protein WCI71_12140 [Bacteroidota bacterium]